MTIIIIDGDPKAVLKDQITTQNKRINREGQANKNQHYSIQNRF